MAVRLTPDIKEVGVFEYGFVPIGSRQKHKHALTLANELAPDFDVLRRGSSQAVLRHREISQEFLDSSRG
jgi:hypothetical protein